MKYNSDIHNRKTIRLKGYDYTNAGYYFITICTKNRGEILCNVGNDALVVPTKLGNEIIRCWNNIERLNGNVALDKFILMPDHIHGIVIIDNKNEEIVVDKKYGFETKERRGRRSLQGIIKDFKSVTTRIYNKDIFCNELKNNLWQKSYYEHIIRDEKELYKIQEYIINNPQNWII